MSAYKDKTQGTWYVSFRYIDWTGKKTQKLKRGFKTKKEALNYEKEFIRKTAADMKMEMNSFIQVYFEDKKNELKENSIRNKQHMMNKHIVPYFGTRKMNEITPAEIIQWQNTIQEKGYSKTYERMIQNQLNALFNHAQKIYNLKENPCKKVKKMGKSDANKLEFWTKAEYDRFIAGIEPGSEDYLIFEILFWTGIREGELLALSLSDFDMGGISCISIRLITGSGREMCLIHQKQRIRSVLLIFRIFLRKRCRSMQRSVMDFRKISGCSRL